MNLFKLVLNLCVKHNPYYFLPLLFFAIKKPWIKDEPHKGGILYNREAV